MMQVLQGIMYIIATLCLNVTIHEACFSPLKCFNSAKHSYCKLKFVDDFAPGQKLLSTLIDLLKIKACHITSLNQSEWVNFKIFPLGLSAVAITL